MNDMIGCAGMLHGWTTIWLTELMWVVPTFVMAVGMVAVMEFVIRSRTRLSTLDTLLHVGPAIAINLVSPKPLASGSVVGPATDIGN
jgi:hypothetical protein